MRIARRVLLLALVGVPGGCVNSTSRYPDSKSGLVVESTPGPGARLGHATAYMDRAGVVLLFGGFQSDGLPLGDTWSWDGRWRLSTTSGPAPRRWPAMTYDSRRGRVILHGGRDGVGSRGRQLDDTWEWDGVRWRLLSATGPGGRDHHRMVYDSVADRVVMFGGWDGRETRADTWVLADDQWQRIAVNGPAPRAAHGMVYDRNRREVVLFGGHVDTTFYSDTWRWNGASWTLASVTGPPPRSFHGMAFDRGRGVVVITGGRRGSLLYGDTWKFDGTRWMQSDTGHPARLVYELEYHAARGLLMFHGGGFLRDGRWTLFSDTWTSAADRWTSQR